ncbi:MAG: hypothetical protein L3J35_05735 [Bacteroidales bacterium]|nr:hypothetical protein [Bacteroidales bacterium]
MKKPYTFISYSVLIINKSVVKSVFVKNKKVKNIYRRISQALSSFKLCPRDEVVNKILKYADL